MNMREAPADVPAVDKGPWVTAFGPDPDSWNIHEDEDEQDGEGCGLPGREVIAQAFLLFADCWGCWDDDIAARAFNLPVQLVHGASRDLMLPADEDPQVVVLTDLGSLIGVLVGTRGSECSVARIARLTNQHPTRVIEAVGSEPWLFLCGDRDDLDLLCIEADGE